MFSKTDALTISGELREGTCSFSLMLEKLPEQAHFEYSLIHF